MNAGFTVTLSVPNSRMVTRLCYADDGTASAALVQVPHNRIVQPGATYIADGAW